ncbi:MAG: methyltransferase [Bacteroidota bacterium]
MFHFKQFSIAQDQCAMKVGTDSILLGAWIKAEAPRYILDIGSGSGVLSLMMAQKFPSAIIHGVEIEPKACQQARENIAASPWKNNVKSILSSIQAYQSALHYDLIISNPPFFSADLAASGKSRSLARKGAELSILELIEQIDRFLAEHGSAHIILPLPQLASLKSLLAAQKMFPQRISTIYPKKGKSPHRFLMAFGKKQKKLVEDELCIQVGGANEYSEAYKVLTQEFYKHSLV